MHVLHLATHGFFASPEAKSALAPDVTARSGQHQIAVVGEHRGQLRGHSPGQLSGLMFAGANHPPQIDPLSEFLLDDGIMTADEIAFLPLERIQLAVLSACETGLGEVAGGEGLLGLQRSMQIAGCGSTISSLWSVDDRAIRALMERFYVNRLERKSSYLDLLREAQLWILRHHDKAFSKMALRGASRAGLPELSVPTSPQLWGAFVLSGDWR